MISVEIISSALHRPSPLRVVGHLVGVTFFNTFPLLVPPVPATTHWYVWKPPFGDAPTGTDFVFMILCIVAFFGWVFTINFRRELAEKAQDLWEDALRAGGYAEPTFDCSCRTNCK